MEICIHQGLAAYTLGDMYLQSQGGYFEIDQFSNGSTSTTAYTSIILDFIINDPHSEDCGIIGSSNGIGYGIKNNQWIYTRANILNQTNIDVVNLCRMQLKMPKKLIEYRGDLEIGKVVENTLGPASSNTFFHIFHINGYNSNICKNIKIFKIIIDQLGNVTEYLPSVVHGEPVLKSSSGKIFHAIGGSVNYGYEKLIRKQYDNGIS